MAQQANNDIKYLTPIAVDTKRKWHRLLRELVISPSCRLLLIC